MVRWERQEHWEAVLRLEGREPLIEFLRGFDEMVDRRIDAGYTSYDLWEDRREIEALLR